MDYTRNRKGWTPAAEEYAEGLSHVSSYPEAYLYATWLGLSGFIIGRRAWITHARPLYPNFYTVLVGPSAQGRKSTAIGLGVATAASFIDDTPPIRTVTTQQGLLQAMIQNGGPALVVLDELSSMTGQTKKDYASDLPQRIVELYDNPDTAGTYTLSNPLTVREPFLNILAASTQEWLTGTLTVTDMMAGLGNRLTFVVGDERQSKPWPGTPRPTLDWSLLYMTEGEVLVTENARNVFTEWYVNFDEAQRKKAPLLRTLGQRMPEKIIKTALVHACWANLDYVDEVMMAQALDWGDYLSESLWHLTPQFEQAEKLVFRVVVNGADTIQKVVRAVGTKLDAYRVKRAIDTLKWMGAVEVAGSSVGPLVESLDE